MFTYITTTTVPSFLDLQDQYEATYAQVNWTVAVPALGLAVGPLIWSSFSDIYGRRVIFIFGTVISFAATIGAALAPDYNGYMASRFFQGFGVSPGATVGLAVINDMYFDHERGQKIGLWVLALDTGLLVGPIFGGFLNLVSAQWIQWFSAIIFAASLIAELAFMPETLYPRNQMLSQFPMIGPDDDSSTADLEKIGRKRSDAAAVVLPRTKKLFFLNIKPVPGMRHPKPWASILRFLQTFRFLVVVIAVFAYCFLWYWFILSIITMLPAAYPDYTPQIQGLLFIGLLLGTVFSELFFSGSLSDLISKKMAKRRGQAVRLPEDRLWLSYPAVLLSAIGLIVWGISIDKMYHWMVGQVAFFIFAAGIQIGNTCICSYIVDAYPLQSMSVITFYSVWLNLSAFLDPVSRLLWRSRWQN
jgi:multidrug resistance protein